MGIQLDKQNLLCSYTECSVLPFSFRQKCTQARTLQHRFLICIPASNVCCCPCCSWRTACTHHCQHSYSLRHMNNSVWHLANHALMPQQQQIHWVTLIMLLTLHIIIDDKKLFGNQGSGNSKHLTMMHNDTQWTCRRSQKG